MKKYHRYNLIDALEIKVRIMIDTKSDFQLRTKVPYPNT